MVSVRKISKGALRMSQPARTSSEASRRLEPQPALQTNTPGQRSARQGQSHDKSCSNFFPISLLNRHVWVTSLSLRKLELTWSNFTVKMYLSITCS